MKPTNYDSQGCDPMSSNCVIWQGPDIDCINLCKGDSISTVVNELALKLCALLEEVNVTAYDLSCLNLQACAPDDFKGLIQLLVDRICALEDIEPGTGSGSTGCPDCEVTVCSSFHYTDNEGNPQTTMQLESYVLAIGNAVCIQVGQINTINATLTLHDGRLDALENATPPSFTIPQVPVDCLFPSDLYDIDAVVDELETQFCLLRAETGMPADIVTALNAALTVVANNDAQLGGIGTMSAIPGWFSSPGNLPESYTNLWRTVGDLRAAVEYIQANCCDTSCGSINLNMNATLLSPTQLRIDYTGSIPAAFIDDPDNSTFGQPYSRLVIENVGGGMGQQIEDTIQVKNTYFTPGQAHIITLNPGLVDGTADVNVNLLLRLEDGTLGTNCESTVQTVALGTDACPDVIIVPSYFELNYSFSWAGASTTFDIELEETANPGVVIESYQIISSNGGNGVFNNLDENTAYRIRLIINTIPCPQEDTSTLEYPDVPATLSGQPVINYASPEGLTLTGATIEAWVAEYETYFGPITP